MFDDYTKGQLTALLAARICAHHMWVRQAMDAGDPAKFDSVLDQAALASAEATTIARIIGNYDELNAVLTEIGIGPLPELSPADKAADERAAEAVVRTKARLTSHLN